MRKLLLAIGAMALLGLTAGCADPVENNPNYNAATNSVMTNFVFNVATGNTPQTKQSGNTVQYNINNSPSVPFRGIGDAWLMTKEGTVGSWIASPVQMNDAIDLGQVLAPSSLVPASTSDSDTKSHRILQISLPVNTTSLVFYGKALRATQSDPNVEGRIEWADVSTKNLQDITISMVPRVKENSDRAKYLLYISQIIEAALNQITLDVKLSSGTEYTGGGQTITLSNDLHWADYAQCVDANTSPVQTSESAGELEKILGRAYVSFTTITQDPTHTTPEWTEVRSGAGTAIARQLSDLAAVTTDVVAATPVNAKEAVAKAFADVLLTEINKFMTSNNWKELSLVRTSLGTNAPAVPATTSSFSPTSAMQNLSQFPNSFDLPAGATQIYFEFVTGTSGPKHFKYKLDQIPLPDMGGKVTSVYKYLYPAELCYFGNSAIRTTDSSSDSYPDGASDWDAEGSWTANQQGWVKNSKVSSSTRSVAMQDNINYSTALLKTTIGYAANLPTDADGKYCLKDNNPNIPGHNPGTDTPNLIPIKADAFQLTGILVGGASKDYDWSFIPKSSADNETYITYDGSIGSTGTGINIPAPTSVAATTSEDIFTMVFDNYIPVGGSVTEQSKVFVALEFKNNSGKDFWGLGNMVRNGGTFYIIGMLNPNIVPGSVTTTTPNGTQFSTPEEGITWPTKYALPPYQTDGSTIKARRVFIQDYMTAVNFKLGEFSLQKAYVTVPDLRSSKIQLGLSVDLVWSTGLDFGDVILGQ